MCYLWQQHRLRGLLVHLLAKQSFTADICTPTVASKANSRLAARRPSPIVSQLVKKHDKLALVPPRSARGVLTRGALAKVCFHSLCMPRRGGAHISWTREQFAPRFPACCSFGGPYPPTKFGALA
jgi:hypothetical protein